MADADGHNGCETDHTPRAMSPAQYSAHLTQVHGKCGSPDSRVSMPIYCYRGPGHLGMHARTRSGFEPTDWSDEARAANPAYGACD